MKPTKRRLAIFDVDGTIFRWSLFIELVDGFVEEGIFPKKAHEEIGEDYQLWLDRKIHYDIFLQKTIETYFKYLKGAKYVDVKRIAKKIIAQKKDRVYRFTRDLIKRLKSKGYFLLIISGSPTYIVEEFAKSFGFDAWYGSEYEVKEGRFTGAPANRDAAFEKGKVLEEFLEKYKNRFDLKKSIAIGDTTSDIPILEAVGEPIAFDPEKKLLLHAKAEGWRIVLERKDVIYDIREFDIIKKV
ncbi:HAD family phosphatase [Candidatus Roizmanbacteria bacterium]|nr:HAD family phosphatase [Candidatus Roizmanbacteria bacterium]